MNPAIPAIDETALATCPSLSSTVNYLGAMTVRPVFYSEHVERNNLELETHTIVVRDARALAEAPELERNGFMLVPHVTRVPDFTRLEEATGIYGREVEAPG